MGNEMSIEEWLAELSSLTAATQGDGMTAAEIADKVGHSALWVRKHILQVAKKQGILVATNGQRENIAGRWTATPVYRFVRPEAKKKGK